jgi:hypothetical protein
MGTSNEPSYRLLAAICGLGFSLWAGTVAVATNLVLQRIQSIEIQVSAGILPRSEERIRSLESRVTRLESELTDHERGHP